MDLPIDVYLLQVEDAIQFAQEGKTPFTPAQIVQTEYHAVNKTGLYYLALKERNKKAMADKTWDSFKNLFVEEYHDLVEDNKVNTGDSIFHSAKDMQEIGRALEHLTMSEGANRDIVIKLKKAVDIQ